MQVLGLCYQNECFNLCVDADIQSRLYLPILVLHERKKAHQEDTRSQS
jgi:hypothetical protein